MGIIYSNAAYLAKAKQNNVCFDKILTIGHQDLNLSSKQIKQLAECCGLKTDYSSVLSNKQYADKFFEIFLNAKSVTSLDYVENVNNASVQNIDNSDYARLKKLRSKFFQVLALRWENVMIGQLQLSNYSFSNKHLYKRWYPFRKNSNSDEQ